jgi:hypothetical protein
VEAQRRARRRQPAGRATALLPHEDAVRLELLCELGIALRAAGDSERSDAALREAAAADSAVGLRARLELAYGRVLRGSAGDAAELLELAGTAIPTLETLGDDRALGRAWLLVGFVHGGIHSRHAAWQEAAERALLHYRRAGFPTAACFGELAAALYYGPTPAAEALARCRELLAGGGLDRVGEANLHVFAAGLEAMAGRIDEARTLVALAEGSYLELGQSALAATYAGAVAADVELLAGNPAGAERRLAEVCRLHEQMGNWSALSTRAADLAEALFRLGRLDEAEAAAVTAEAHAQEDDLTVQPLWRGVRAKVIAARGLSGAESLARDAVALAERTDALNLRARVRLDLAEVLADRPADAAAEVEEAVRLYERKGNTVAAERARAAAADRVPA